MPFVGRAGHPEDISTVCLRRASQKARNKVCNSCIRVIQVLGF